FGAPDHRYTAHLVDCETATCHFLSAAQTEFSVDSHRVAVGNSKGAILAAAVCQRLGRRKSRHLPFPCAQVLIYLTMQMADFNLPSYQQNHAAPTLFCGRIAFYFLLLNGELYACHELPEKNCDPTEPGPCYEKLPLPLPLSASQGFCQHRTSEYEGEVYKAGLREVSPLLTVDAIRLKTPQTFVPKNITKKRSGII
ncbi:LOW QUALITY PROTEIN: arylacetamide deacetylase-like 4, partial [Odontesthes bonariensis]